MTWAKKRTCPIIFMIAYPIKIVHLYKLPFPIGQASLNLWPYRCLIGARTEGELYLTIYYFQSHEVISIIEAAIVKEKAVLHLSCKPEKKLCLFKRNLSSWIHKTLAFSILEARYPSRFHQKTVSKNNINIISLETNENVHSILKYWLICL